MIGLRIAALAAAALLAVGCGGGEGDDRRAIEQTVIDYFVAFAADEGERACDRLSTTARDQLVEQTGVKDCPAAIAKARQDPRIKQHLPDLARVRIGAVEIKENNATAEVKGLGASSSVPLVKEGDSWKIGGISAPGEE